MNKKGFFFTLDAILAISVSLLFFGILFYWSAHLDVGDLRQNELLGYSQSVASVMEKQDGFAQNNLSSFLGNNTRNGTCFNVSVYSPAGILQYSSLKIGCTNTTYPLSVSRSFVSGNSSLYLARLEGWYA